MSYENPPVPASVALTGIDIPIEDIRQRLAVIPWMDKAFGRAFEFKEADPETGKTRRVPKIYAGDGEYFNVLPNDNLVAQSFIAVKGAQTWAGWSRYVGNNPAVRILSVIVWVNLRRIDPDADYVFTEKLRADVQFAIETSPYVRTIDTFVDERAEDVFDTFDLQSVGLAVDDIATQYLMHPFTGFRFDFTVEFNDNLASCSRAKTVNLAELSARWTDDFIFTEFVAGDQFNTLPIIDLNLAETVKLIAIDGLNLRFARNVLPADLRPRDVTYDRDAGVFIFGSTYPAGAFVQLVYKSEPLPTP